MNTWSTKLISHARRLLLLSILALLCWPVNTAAQSQQKGESTISGHVIFADTGRPVRRATVRLFTGLNYRAVRVTPANARGEFRFSELPAGSYFVVADDPAGISRKAMAITEFGLGIDNEAEHTRVTVDGKGATRCEVRVVRGGTIRGTILYADKEPVTGAQIMLFRRWNGGTVPLVIEALRTNDRGTYRVDGLPEGEYFVGVVDGRRKLKLNGPREMRGFVTAYYPGVSNIGEAKPIEIQSGSEVTGVNITFGGDELRRIWGVVRLRNETYRISRATVSLRRKDEPRVQASIDNVARSITSDVNRQLSGMRDAALLMTMLPPMTEVDQEGAWAFEDLPPGTYVLNVYASIAPNQKPARTEGYTVSGSDDDHVLASAQLELTLKDEDLTDLVVELSEGVSVSGSVVTLESQLPRIRVSLQHEAAELLRFLPVSLNENGTFVVHSVPSGEVRVDVNIPPGSDQYLKSITLGSQDLMRNPLRVEEGVNVNHVQITLATGLATVGGRVLFSEGGGLASGSGVLFVRADQSLWHLDSSRVFVAANAAGEFELRCAPGDYLVFTWPAGGQPYQAIDVFVRSQSANAKRVTLQSKEDRRIDLTVVKPKR